MTEKMLQERDLYDRRSGSDRRIVVNLTELEKRLKNERLEVLEENRSAWTRETQWGSVFVDLLR